MTSAKTIKTPLCRHVFPRMASPCIRLARAASGVLFVVARFIGANRQHECGHYKRFEFALPPLFGKTGMIPTTGKVTWEDTQDFPPLSREVARQRSPKKCNPGERKGN